MFPREHRAGPANPIALYKGEGIGNPDDSHLVARRPQAFHSRAGRETFKVPFPAEDEKAHAAVGQQNVFCSGPHSRCAKGRSGFAKSKPPKTVHGIWSKIRTTKLLRTRLISLANRRQVAIDPATSGWPLIAGRARGGKDTEKTNRPTPAGTGDESNYRPNRVIRCGKLLLRHFSRSFTSVASRPIARAGKSPRHATKGEAARAVNRGQLHEAHHHVLSDEWECRWGRAEGGRPNALRKLLKLFRHKLRTAGTAGLYDPRVKPPSAAKRIPASMDQTTPAGSPNLLERRRIASTVSVRTCALTGGHARRLRGTALYK